VQRPTAIRQRLWDGIAAPHSGFMNFCGHEISIFSLFLNTSKTVIFADMSYYFMF
jgi:hypothetical protein